LDIREFLFNHRGYTPIPLFIAVVILARPSGASFLGGLTLMLLGEALRLWAVSHAGSATRTTSGVGGEQLVTSGPYAYVRNPLYLGNFLLTVGFCIMAWAWMPWMLLVAVALFTLQYGLIISLEEEYLRRRFGEAYEDYCRHVPRFLPRPACPRPRGRPWAGRPSNPGSWGQAFRSEKSTLLNFALSVLVLGLRWKVF